MSYTLCVQRRVGQRTSDSIIQKQIDYLIGRALGGARGKSWSAQYKRVKSPCQENGLWVFVYQLTFEKNKGQKGGSAEYSQWSEIQAMLGKTGSNSKFGQYPWEIVEENSIKEDSANQPEGSPKNGEKVLSNVRDVVIPSKVKTFSELLFPEELIGENSDEHLANHPCFQHIYGLNPQIRTILTAIKAARETDGKMNFHHVLYGPPGCGKTTVLLAIEELLGEGAVLRLDTTATTRPGIERLFFDQLKEIPPIISCEEIEKAKEDGLQVWLGALDDRQEIRKVNFHQARVLKIQILFLCTCNNKRAFDRMMNNGTEEQGALSSRCVNQIYFPRPTEETLKLILKREIDKRGGDYAWVEPCIKLAREMKLSDPRQVRAFLAGGEKLLDGSYQKDRLHSWEQAKSAGEIK